MTDPQLHPGEAIAHTVITHDAAGTVHVQRFGAAHVVEVDEWVTVPAGRVIGIRHVGETNG